MPALDAFHPPTAAWFRGAFAAPTRVQEEGWGHIAAGEHTLLLAPTGSGKTLAAFLSALDALQDLPFDAPPGVRVVYVSPLKALVVDVERNLRAPLRGIEAAYAAQGQIPRPIRVDIRTGDTPSRDRRLQLRNPAEVLVTTPESLFLLLGTRARETLRTVTTIIVDEIHAVAGTKRGVHLALSIERLSELCAAEPQRIGLSATQRPLEEIASYLGGDRPVAIVDASAPPAMDLQVIFPDPVPVPVPLPERRRGAAERPARPLPGMWPAIHPRILELIRSHRSTIVFTNSRLLCERLAKALNELAGEELVRAHHGSIASHRRAETEEQLKSGALRAIVATSSLELGIDMGAVDLVVQVESPGSVARGLQRIGRAGHHVGGVSIGRIFPKFRGDLVECAVVAQQMRAARIESTRVPRNCLDVLAQQIVAAVAVDPRTVDDIERLVRRAYPYRDLSRDALVAVLDMLSGRYPADDFGELRPRIVWDRDTDALRPRKGSGLLALVNAGTIPDRGLFGVFLGEKGPRIGELDEEMVFESRPGQTVILGASTWRIEAIERDRVVVTPAPGEPGRMPFWRGEGPGRPIELGRALGAFLRTVSADPTQLDAALDPVAASQLVAYVGEQQAMGAVPTDEQIVVERFRDQLGDWRICILSPFGARVHAPWAMLLEALIGARLGFDLQVLSTDDGISLRFADAEEIPDANFLFSAAAPSIPTSGDPSAPEGTAGAGLPDAAPRSSAVAGALIPDPDLVEELLLEQLRGSAMFASRFRENAARALLLPRRHPGRRQPLWMQRLKAQNLLAVASRFPSFPIVLETYRELLGDVFDVPGLIGLLRAIRSREVRVVEVETPKASPFAQSLVFAWAASYLYEGDAPLAERKAQALTLDRDLLRDILGQAELRDLLDPEAVSAVEADLQRLAEDRRARDPDQVHDLLRRLGDLTAAEVSARSEGIELLATLESEKRAVRLIVAGEERWVAVEDAARYRDGLGAALPDGLPKVWTEASEAPVEDLVLRYARTHGPFLAGDVAARLGLPVGAAEAVLRGLLAVGKLEHGDIRPGGTGPEWCDPDVLRRLRRASLARIRNEVAPVGPEGFARWLPKWMGVGSTIGGHARLREVVAQLEGAALPWSELIGHLLPARVADFRPQMLDELGAMGEIAWVGRGALGKSDGRVAIYRRDRVSTLVEPPGPYAGDPLHAALVAHLERRGACFLVELATAGQAPLEDVVAALWDLVWAGQITNDTFQPLQELGRARKKAGASRMAGGRWALVRDLVGIPADPTRRAHALAQTLLERWGVVGREMAAVEELTGGFAAVYPVLRAMEEQGRVRRGYFVEGLGGAQFAMPGAVDRLRSGSAEGSDAMVLAAVDPAQPYGAVLAWPEGAKGRRVAGASVVLVEGAPVLFLEKGGASLTTLPAFVDDTIAERALAAFQAHLARERKRTWHLERIDGLEAATSPHAERLFRLGWARDYKGIVWSRAL